MDKFTIDNLKNYLKEISLINPFLIDAYLFGSFATNKQKINSDIDIALIIENLLDEDKFDTQVKLLVLASKYDSRIEPHPISLNEFGGNNPFVNEIKKNGVKLYGFDNDLSSLL